VSDVFLGIIAVAVLVMASIQVAAIVVVARMARRLDRFADRLEQDIRPVVASLQALTADAARATSVFKAILAIFRGPRKENRTGTADEEDPLFIG
jgi:outer membrane murein-binding lipoprotein Lpp